MTRMTSTPLPPLHQRLTRRALLRGGFHGAAAALAGSTSLLCAPAAAAQGDYRALVCIFLYGGNDAYNTVLATDARSWTHYLTVRRSEPEPLALQAPWTAADPTAPPSSSARLGGVLPVEPRHGQGRRFALHPAMTDTADLFHAGRLAVIANVGPLLQPMTKADWRDRRFQRPPSLQSHNDQQAVWQSGSVEGSRIGWGGRLADAVVDGATPSDLAAISTTGRSVWLSGVHTRPYEVSESGPVRIAGDGLMLGPPAVQHAVQAVMRRAPDAGLLGRDWASTADRSIRLEAHLRSVLPAADAAPFGTRADADSDPLLQYLSPEAGGAARLNPLARQMQVAARMISAQASHGVRRQIFFMSLGGFDTHDGQNRAQAEGLARLSHALGYFDRVLGALGLRDAVTTFTMSEFGRAFPSNGDGTDHGWGGHHLVMGGAVRGGDIYGRFPAYGAPDGRGGFDSPDQVDNGMLLPTTSVDQYAATLGRWFGVDDAALLAAFPKLKAWSPQQRLLNFLA